MRNASPALRRRLTRFSILASSLLLGPPSSAVTIDWVPVGNAGNPSDTPSSNCYAASCGSVSYDYYISKHEVTNKQYAEFLNGKAASDPYSLWTSGMASGGGGITRSGVSGSYVYGVTTGYADKPVRSVGFHDTLRFANWLHNGQGSGDTETGAYTLLGGTPTPANGDTVTRNALATVFLTSENEWYKAAYHSSGGLYFDYPAGTNAATVCAAPPNATPNRALCDAFSIGYGGPLADVGSYSGSASPYGTYDQGGNLLEWNEQIVSGTLRGQRGGWYNAPFGQTGAAFKTADLHSFENVNFGFRVASLVPEPGTGLLLGAGLVALGARRGRRRRR